MVIYVLYESQFSARFSEVRMNKTGNIYINLEDFQKFILDYVQSDEINKAFESTIFFNNTAKSEFCFQAIGDK